MATRTDVRVDFFLSPRVVRIAAPSEEMTIQDLHDTLRNIEDEPNAMQYEDLISSAGKEELGGGVTVGITSTLKNAMVAFDARKVSVSAGTVTTPDATGFTLIDSAATFITDLVKTGAWVVNTTDGSVASVVSVDSETQLTTDGLGDGTDDGFDSADVYKIWNVIQVEVSGGNLVAEDALGSPIDAILPTMGTQVVRTSSASATLRELLDIQYSSFGGGVTVDLTSAFSGTSFPIGTPRQPVNNFIDALTIAAERGFGTLFIVGDATIDGGLDFTGFIFMGESKSKTTLTIDTSAIVTRAEFLDATITGTLDGEAKLRECVIQTLMFVNGFIEQCVLEGTITLGGASVAQFLDCWSGVIGVATPIIDMGGSGQALALRNYNGGIELQNKTGTEEVSIDLNSGHVVLNATVSDGAIIVRGIGEITDNSTGSATVQDETVSGVRQQLIAKILRNELITDPVAGTITVLDDDDVTVLLTAPLFEDTAETQPYRGLGVNVRKRMT